nr:hypothetical protein GTC16762_33910 [Pigmentibacter ruber]
MQLNSKRARYILPEAVPLEKNNMKKNFQFQNKNEIVKLPSNGSLNLSDIPLPTSLTKLFISALILIKKLVTLKAYFYHLTSTIMINI